MRGFPQVVDYIHYDYYSSRLHFLTRMFARGGGKDLQSLETLVLDGQRLWLAALPGGAMLEGKRQRLGLTGWMACCSGGVVEHCISVKTNVLEREQLGL